MANNIIKLLDFVCIVIFITDTNIYKQISCLKCYFHDFNIHLVTKRYCCWWQVVFVPQTPLACHMSLSPLYRWFGSDLSRNFWEHEYLSGLSVLIYIKLYKEKENKAILSKNPGQVGIQLNRCTA